MLSTGDSDDGATPVWSWRTAAATSAAISSTTSDIHHHLMLGKAATAAPPTLPAVSAKPVDRRQRSSSSSHAVPRSLHPAILDTSRNVALVRNIAITFERLHQAPHFGFQWWCL